MTRPVAFVCSNQTHVRMFTPVARLLVQGNQAPVCWVALDRYYRHDAESALRQDGWTDSRLLSRPSGATGTPWEGGALARVRVLRDGRTAVRGFLRDIRPGVIVLGNDLGPLERLFIQHGRALGIATLLVQDGVIALHEKDADRITGLRGLLQSAMTAMGLRLPDARGYGQNGAERIAVMGEAVGRWLQQQGVTPTRISVTGQPRYDYLFGLQQGTALPETLDSLGLPKRQKIILFSSQPYLRYNACSEAAARQVWLDVIHGVKGLGEGHHLVAKLHPAEDLAWTRRWLGEDFPPGWMLTRDADVFSLIFHADAVVTVGSTTALEALYLDKPVIILETNVMSQPIPYVGSGAALHAEGAAKLTARLKEALYDESVRRHLGLAGGAFAREYAHAMDGKVAGRVAHEILVLCSERE